MNRAVIICAVCGSAFFASLAARLFWHPNVGSGSSDILLLEEKHRNLAEFAPAMGDLEGRAARVRSALWTSQAVEAFVAELPPGWSARPLNVEPKAGIKLARYAFSKEALVRDFPEFQRVLRRLEDRSGVRIDSVALTANQDGKRFSTALITATIPVADSP